MPNLGKQDQSQLTETTEQISEISNETSSKPEQRRLLIPKMNISKIILLFRQYGISVAINLVILGAVCFLFFVQKDWIKGGNKVIGRIVEEKVKETLKNINLDSGVAETPGQNGMKTGEGGLSKQNGEMKKIGLEVKVNIEEPDNSKYIIEANRVYEQGDFEKAAALYEKGLDKSMPFLNEDFVVYRLGDCYLRSGKFEEALKVFQTLNNDYINTPYQFKSRLKMGECYAGMGEFKKARKTLYTIVAQEGKCYSEDDKSAVVDSYFKIADYYMEEAKKLHAAVPVGTSSSAQGLDLKHVP